MHFQVFVILVIQSKTLGLWSSDDSLDDGVDNFVEEVLSTMSEVLAENVHILQENASSPSDYAEDTYVGFIHLRQKPE